MLASDATKAQGATERETIRKSETLLRSEKEKSTEIKQTEDND